MSKCISHQGEYSEHEFVPENRFICQRCFVFDEEPALAALELAESKVAAVTALAAKWAASAPYRPGVFYPEAFAYAQGRDDQRELDADELSDLLVEAVTA